MRRRPARISRSSSRSSSRGRARPSSSSARSAWRSHGHPSMRRSSLLTISCSYGPGRYDPLYEQAGIDYPVGHVRWTENRNMQAALDLMARGQLDTTALVTHRFPIERATEAYDLITGKTTERYLGILLDFPERPVEVRRRVEIRSRPLTEGADPIVAGFVGAGNFATSYLLPHLVKKNVSLAGVATTRPVSAKSVGDKFGFAFCTHGPRRGRRRRERQHDIRRDAARHACALRDRGTATRPQRVRGEAARRHEGRAERGGGCRPSGIR